MPIAKTKTIVQEIGQTTPAGMLMKMTTLIKSLYTQTTTQAIDEAYRRIVAASTTFSNIIELAKPSTQGALVDLVLMDFFLEFVETGFVLAAMYQSGNFKGMSDSQMAGLVLYINIFGKEMLEAWLNIKVSPDYNSFVLKQDIATAYKFPVLEYVHGCFVGIIRTLRECRPSKLLSYNLFFFYNE